MKAIISPYEEVITERNGIPETIGMPSVIVDIPSDFSSSDIPSSVLYAQDGERLIFMSAEAHTLAVAFGYTEVEVETPWQ